MKTPDKIIEQSIHLFNTHGISKVSLRHISSGLGISIGNLTYHYKNKAAILAEIYRRMDREMSDAVFPGSNEADLFHYENLLQRISEFQQRHRFFYMDMLEISRQYPEVIERYRETIAIRRGQTDQLFQSLVNKGFLQKEKEPGFYLNLTHAIWVMSTFWLQQKHVLGSNHPAIQSNGDRLYVWHILQPWLTKKGIEQWKQIQENEYTIKIS